MNNAYTIASEIQKILNVDLNIDWSWYHEAIDNLLQQHGFFFPALDTDVLNAKRVKLENIVEWLDELVTEKQS